MGETMTYQVGPALASSPAGQAGDWLAVSGPAQQNTSAMAARIAFLERELAKLEAAQSWQGERLSGCLTP